MKPPQTPRNPEWIKKRAVKVRLSVGAEKLPVKEGRLTALARLIEEHPIVRLLAVGGIIAALIAFTLDSKDRKEERLARAWQLVTTKTEGNGGKVTALKILYSLDANIDGLDLSCESQGGTISSKAKEQGEYDCSPYVFLEDLELSSKSYIAKRRPLRGINFKSTVLNNAISKVPKCLE